jgi:hypothetical protein
MGRADVELARWDQRDLDLRRRIRERRGTIARRAAETDGSRDVRNIGLPKPTDEDIHILAFTNGKEKYVFTYDGKTRAEVLRRFGRFASNPELSFSWYDAAVLSGKVQEEQRASRKSHG